MISMGRFMASVQGAQCCLPYWPMEAYETLTLAMETDVLKGKKVEVVALKHGAPEAVGEKAAATDPSLATALDKSLRSNIDNGIQLKSLLVLDDSNERIGWIVCVSSTSLRDWNSEYAIACRSVGTMEAFWIDQVTGAFMKNMESILKKTSSPVDLQKCKFILRSPEAKLLDANEVEHEDPVRELARLATLSGNDSSSCVLPSSICEPQFDTS